MSAIALALTLVRALPASPARLLARLLLLFWVGFKPSCRAEIRANYRAIFGHDRPWFWVANAWRLGGNLCLMAQARSSRVRFLIDKAGVSGDNNYQQYMARNMQVVMASFHLGLWEFLPRVFRGRGHPVAVAVGRQRDLVLGRALDRLRSDDGISYLRGAKEILRHCLRSVGCADRDSETGRRKPPLVGCMLDNTSRGKMTRAEAGGVRMRLPELPWRISESIRRVTGYCFPPGQTGVMPLFCTLERNRLRVRVYPPGDPGYALGCLLAEVRRSPADWVFWGKGEARVTKGEK